MQNLINFLTTQFPQTEVFASVDKDYICVRHTTGSSNFGKNGNDEPVIVPITNTVKYHQDTVRLMIINKNNSITFISNINMVPKTNQKRIFQKISASERLPIRDGYYIGEYSFLPVSLEILNGTVSFITFPEGKTQRDSIELDWLYWFEEIILSEIKISDKEAAKQSFKSFHEFNFPDNYTNLDYYGEGFEQCLKWVKNIPQISNPPDAIAFLEWTRNTGWKFKKYEYDSDTTWWYLKMQITDPEIVKTSKELYELFIGFKDNEA